MVSLPENQMPTPAHWDGAVNAWLIRPGLYRMGRPEWLTDAGWKQMVQQSGVTTVVDVRTPPEVSRRNTDRDPDAYAASYGVRRIHLPIEDINNAEYWDRNAPYPMHPDAYPDMMDTFGDRVADALIVMLDAWTAGGAVAVHCTAGRDRTGLVIGLLLQLPGLPGGHPERGASWEEQARIYAAGAAGINEHHRTSAVKHPYESYQPPEEFDRALAGRLASLRRFLNDWPAEKVSQLIDERRVN